jgi:hypothetical protein
MNIILGIVLNVMVVNLGMEMCFVIFLITWIMMKRVAALTNRIMGKFVIFQRVQLYLLLAVFLKLLIGLTVFDNKSGSMTGGINMVKRCPYCNKECSTHIEYRRGTYSIFKENISLDDIPVVVCNTCKNDIWDDELDDATLVRFYHQYNKYHVDNPITSVTTGKVY